MKLVTIALGAGIGIGYLAANEDARNRAFASLKQAKESTQSKSIEHKVSGAVSGAVSQLSDRRKSAQSDTDVWDDTTPSNGRDNSVAVPADSDRSVIG